MSVRVCPTCSAELPAGVERCPADDTELVVLEPTRVRAASRPDEFGEPTTVGPAPPEAEPPRAQGPPPLPLTAAERTTVVDPLLGARVGEYVVQARIGEGGMGEVYLAAHPLIGKRVAIKCLKPEVASNAEEAARLLSEARAANAIGHRGVIDIFGFGTLPDGRQYFVMEYLQGQSLEQRLAEGRMALPEALGVMEEVLGILSAAHGAGVIHRDLKPSNIFLVQQPDGSTFVKLLDFGLAKQGAAHGLTPQTNVARFIGTPAYTAPEQAMGQAVGPRTDLYAFGCVAFEMLTGQPVYDAVSPWLVLKQHLSSTPRRPSEVRAGLPAEVDALALSLLARDSEARPASAEVARNEVRRLRRRLVPAVTSPGMLAARPEPALALDQPPPPVARPSARATPLQLERVVEPPPTSSPRAPSRGARRVTRDHPAGARPEAAVASGAAAAPEPRPERAADGRAETVPLLRQAEGTREREARPGAGAVLRWRWGAVALAAAAAVATGALVKAFEKPALQPGAREKAPPSPPEASPPESPPLPVPVEPPPVPPEPTPTPEVPPAPVHEGERATKMPPLKAPSRMEKPALPPESQLVRLRKRWNREKKQRRAEDVTLLESTLKDLELSVIKGTLSGDELQEALDEFREVAFPPKRR